MDDLLPNDAGSSVFEPEVNTERNEAIVAEKSAVLAAAPLLEMILDWFDDAIDWSKSIEGMDNERKLSIEAQLEAKLLYKTFLEQGRSRLVALKDEHLAD